MDSFRDTSDSQTWQMSRLVHSKLSTVISDHFRRPGKTLAEAVSAKPGTPGARLLTLMLTLNPRLANKLARQEKTYGLEFELTDNNLLVGWPGSKQRLLLDERDTETFWRMSLVGTDALLLRSEEYVRRLSAMIEFEVDHLIHRNSLTRLDDD